MKEFLLTPMQTAGAAGGGTVTGTGANTQVAFWTAASVIAGSANLLWNGSTFSVNGNTNLQGGAIILGKVVSTGINYNVLTSDFYIRVVPVPPAPITITLPAVATASTGQIYVIKDGVGFAGIGTELTISAQAGETIDGTLTKVYNVAFTSITVRNSGATWDII